MNKILAFIKKDFLITISYRFDIILQFSKMALSLFVFYFIGLTFSGTISPYLKQYGGSYFSYVLVGLAVSSFVSVGLGALAREVRSAQVEGTLEALLSTPTSVYKILVGNSLWTFIAAFISSFIMLSFGVIALGLSISLLNGMAAMLVLFLTLIAFLAIGMLSASFIMIFKQGNPIGMIFGTSSYFLGGIIFPVEVLPGSFQAMSAILPITHALKALRGLLLANMEIQSILQPLINLTIFIVILSPVSILFFQYAVKRARRDGSLVQY